MNFTLFLLGRARARALLLLIVGVTITRCVSPPIIDERTIQDEELSCLEIRDQSNKLRTMRADVESGKGVSGANTAMFVMFWPGIFFNEINSNKALEAISKRQAALADIYSSKGCNNEK